ncbi:hypothetical protein ACHAWX_000473 [Stephanocyclus meneghinianus]
MTSSSTPSNPSQPSVEDAPTLHENKITARIKKLLIIIPILVLLLFAVIDSQTSRHIQNAFQSLLDWISTHLAAGIFVLIAVYILATVAFLPGSILTVGSGFVYGKAFGLGYGVVIASGVAFVGACGGAIISFLLGRYLLREWVGERLVERYPIFKALDEALKQQGFKIFLLLRLSPIIPFNAINYIGGITGVSLKDYSLALGGILPGTILFCFIGASAGNLSESQDRKNGPATIAAVVVGIILSLIAVYVMSTQAKKEFNKIVEQQEQDVTEHDGSILATHNNDPESV